MSSRPSHRSGPDRLEEKAPSLRANLLPYSPIKYGVSLSPSPLLSCLHIPSGKTTQAG